MGKPKARTAPSLSTYKFDTSTYVVLGSGVRRDAVTGALVKTAVTKGGGRTKSK